MSGFSLEEAIIPPDEQERETPSEIIPFNSMNPGLGKSVQQIEEDENSNINEEIEQQEEENLEENNLEENKNENEIQEQEEIDEDEIRQPSSPRSEGQDSTNDDQCVISLEDSNEPVKGSECDGSNQERECFEETKDLNSSNALFLNEISGKTRPVFEECEHKNIYKSIGEDFTKKIFTNDEFFIKIENSIGNKHLKEFQDWVEKDLKCFTSKRMFIKAYFGDRNNFEKNQEQILCFRKLLEELANQYFNNNNYVKKYLDNSKKMQQQIKDLYGKLIHHFQVAVKNPEYFKMRWIIKNHQL